MSADTKHTPGPWRMNQEVPGAPIAITKPTEHGPGVFCRVLDIEDARLIAAAPDLLAALTELVWAQELHEEGESNPRLIDAAMSAARAAIARGRGDK